MSPLFQRKPEQTWKSDQFIWLENASDQHVKLHLPSGELRLDKGRKLRFQPDILDLPQVKSLIENGQLSVQE
ncbi:MAG TPA: hypothetical protein G4N94_12780 [Caldilineae bacterium]|nr:hypothetical protein [Caldilineae bacterium]